jgi:hypothetical protein
MCSACCFRVLFLFSFSLSLLYRALSASVLISCCIFACSFRELFLVFDRGTQKKIAQSKKYLALVDKQSGNLHLSKENILFKKSHKKIFFTSHWSTSVLASISCSKSVTNTSCGHVSRPLRIPFLRFLSCVQVSTQCTVVEFN